MRYAIIGGGVAGITAAKTLREHAPDAKITVYTFEIHPFGLYARKDMARRLITGIQDGDELLLESEATLAEQGIELHYEEVLRVFPHLKQVLLPRHIRLNYDRLLLATGATPCIIDAPGLHYIGVHQVRNYEDISLIEAWMPQLQQSGAVVIGGGILGMDMAYALNRRGVPTTLVAREKHLGIPSLSETDAALAEKCLRAEGMQIVLGETLAAYLSEDNRVLDGVRLSSGRIIPGRMALCTVGVSPTTDFLIESEVEIDAETGAIWVNANLQTNQPNVYAAGNCAQIDGYIARTWKQSAEQGRVAALNMLGQSTLYHPPVAETITPLILESIQERV